MPARPRSNAPAHPPHLPAFKCARALLGSAAKCASPPTRPPACERAPARATRAPAPGPLHLVLTFDTARRRLRRRRLVSALDQPQHLWCAIPRAPASHCRRAPAHQPHLPAFKCALGSAAKCASPSTRPPACETRPGPRGACLRARARARESLQKRGRPAARLPARLPPRAGRPAFKRAQPPARPPALPACMHSNAPAGP